MTDYSEAFEDLDQRAALAILADDPTARRMVAAWPYVGRDTRNDASLRRAWAIAAGEDELVIADKAPMLFACRLCLPHGLVPPGVQRFLAAYAVATVTRGKRPGGGRYRG